MTAMKHSGVWLSNVPLDANESVFGDTLLLVELDLSELEMSQYEWVEKEKPYREWLVPAALLNAKARIRILKGDVSDR